MRFTDVADTEQLFRLIQSIPSPKAEPFKMWLAKVGRERIDEIEDSEISKEKKPRNFEENKKIARQGGSIAGNARREIEEKTKKKDFYHFAPFKSPFSLTNLEFDMKVLYLCRSVGG